MPLDHSKANVTISVAGIAISCINKVKRNRYETAFLRCDRHKPVLDIQKIEIDTKTGKRLRSSLVPHSLNLDEDIFIDVEHPNTDKNPDCQKGVSTYMRREFNRLDDTGDAEDFRWVADLEGPEFHNRKLKIQHKQKLKPTLFISEGILYAKEKTDEALARISTKGLEAAVPLGRFAYGINTDITCENGSTLVLRNRFNTESSKNNSCCSVRLLQSNSIRYLITIENHCRLDDEIDGTDFRLFYEVVKDPKGNQFDLRRIVETGCYAAPEESIGGRMDYSLDGFPQNCLTAFVSETTTLEDSYPES